MKFKVTWKEVCDMHAVVDAENMISALRCVSKGNASERERVVRGSYKVEQVPADCPLPDAEDVKHPVFFGVDLASGPDRTVIWPDDDADIAAEEEEEGC